MYTDGQFQNKFLTEFLTNKKLEECSEFNENESNYKIYKDSNSNEIHCYDIINCDLKPKQINNNLDKFHISFSLKPEDKDNPIYIKTVKENLDNSEAYGMRYIKKTDSYVPINDESKKYIILNSIDTENHFLNRRLKDKEIQEFKLNYIADKIENDHPSDEELEFLNEYKNISLRLLTKYVKDYETTKHKIELLNKMLKEIK